MTSVCSLNIPQGPTQVSWRVDFGGTHQVEAVLVLLDGGVHLNLLSQHATQCGAGARRLAVLLGPGVGELLGLEERLDDADVHALQHGVADLLQVRLVAGAPLLRAHEAVLKDEGESVTHIVVATLVGLLRDQARHALLGHRACREKKRPRQSRSAVTKSQPATAAGASGKKRVLTHPAGGC